MQKRSNKINSFLSYLFTNSNVFEWILLITGWLILLATLHPGIGSDGAIRYQALIQLYEYGSTPNIKYSLIQPILSVPFIWVADIFSITRLVTAYFNFTAFVIGTLIIYHSMKVVVGYSIARYFLIILTATSMVPHHLQHYFGEVLTGLLLWYGFISYFRNPVISVMAISIAIINSPALIPALVVTALIRFIRKKYDWLILVMVLVTVMGFLLEVFLKYGSLTNNPYFSAGETGYRTILPYSGLPGFSYPLFFGVISILFSFGKGLVFYIPGIFLIMSDNVRKEIKHIDLPWDIALIFMLVSILTYGMWWSWYGGNFWGPRFFLFLCFPASLFLAILINNMTVYKNNFLFLMISFVLLLSIWVGIDGYLYGQANMDACWGNNYALEFLCWYVPEFSALWRPFVEGFRVHEAYQNQLLFVVWQVFIFIVLFIKLFSRYKNIKQLAE